MITLRVDGEPAPQGSKSVGRHGGVYEKSKKVGPWRTAVRAALLIQNPRMIPGPVHVEIMFILARPASHYRTGRYADTLKPGAQEWPGTRPDLDKLIRSTLDALTAGGAYADDGRVTSISAEKRYAKPGERPGAWITVQEEVSAG